MRKTAFVKRVWKAFLLSSPTRNLDAIIGHPDYSAATISNDACLLKMKVCHCFLLMLQLIYWHIDILEFSRYNDILVYFRNPLSGQNLSSLLPCQRSCRLDVCCWNWNQCFSKTQTAPKNDHYVFWQFPWMQDTAAGSMVTVTGWGTTSEGALGLPNVLHKVRSNILHKVRTNVLG